MDASSLDRVGFGQREPPHGQQHWSGRGVRCRANGELLGRFGPAPRGGFVLVATGGAGLASQGFRSGWRPEDPRPCRASHTLMGVRSWWAYPHETARSPYMDPRGRPTRAGRGPAGHSRSDSQIENSSSSRCTEGAGPVTGRRRGGERPHGAAGGHFSCDSAGLASAFCRGGPVQVRESAARSRAQAQNYGRKDRRDRATNPALQT